MKNPENLKIVFMGTPDFAAEILDYLIKKGFNITAVISQPDKPFGRGKKLKATPVKKVALDNGIKLYQPEKLKEIYSDLNNINPDMIITAAFGKILSDKLISIPKYGCWNIHASLLPKYRGAAPIQRAIENGEKETGISIFKIVKDLDAGPIALKEKVKIFENDNLENIYEKLLKISKNLIEYFLKNFENINLVEQDHSMATYADKISKKEMKLNFEDVKKTHDKIRAFDPCPGTFALYKDKKVKLFGSEIYKTKIEGTPGKIVGLEKNSLLLETKNGILKIAKIQFPGKKTMTGKDAFNGNLISENDILK